MNYDLTQILGRLREEEINVINKEQNISIRKAASPDNADAESVVWIRPGLPNAAAVISNTGASLIICDEQTCMASKEMNPKKVFLVVKDPRRIFSKLVNHLLIARPAAGIHPTAFIHPKARIGKNCYIGPFTYIGEATVGDNTLIHGHSHIYDNVHIGSHGIIHAGVVIGSDGFGFSKDENGTIEKFPHLGGVIIGNQVEIGANTCIDRGALGNTIIHDGVKIDNLVHIAHNVVIEGNVFIIANSMIGGSTQIGSGAWVAPSVSLLQQLKIGQNATIGVGSVVTKDIPAGETWTGVPARPLEEFLLLQKKMKKLP